MATVIATVSYTEPTTNSNGSALTDLKQTEIYYQIGAAAPVQAAVVPATKASGGGNVSQPVTLTVPDAAATTVSFWSTAEDLASPANESPKSTTGTKTFDLLPPAAPSNLVVQ